MKRAIALAVAVVLITAGCGGSSNNDDERAGLANPASVYCEEQGGTVEIRTDEAGNQTGYCVFSDGTEVDEWAYFRGEAQPAAPTE